MSTQDLRAKLKADEGMASYRNIVRMIRDRVDLDAYRRDLKVLATGRLLPGLYGKPPSAGKLYDAIAKEAATRASLTSMRSVLMTEESLLARTMQTVESHIRYAYHDYLRELASTAEAKKVLMRKILNQGFTLKSAIDDALLQIDYLIKDIDQANYNASNMVRLFGHIVDPKYQPN